MVVVVVVMVVVVVVVAVVVAAAVAVAVIVVVVVVVAARFPSARCSSLQEGVQFRGQFWLTGVEFQNQIRNGGSTSRSIWVTEIQF